MHASPGGSAIVLYMKTHRTGQMNFWIQAETRELFERIKARDGVSYGEQLRRAMQLFAESKGIPVPKRRGPHAA
jgi:hypothetical protein